MKDYEMKHIFMAIAICIAVVSPIFILLFPNFIANTLYHTPESWYMIVAGKTYGVYAVGFLFLILSPSALFLLEGRKLSVLIVVACLLLSALTFYIASLNYTSLETNSISYREMFKTEKHTYAWSDIDQVFYHPVNENEGYSKFEFHFIDGNELTLPERNRGLRESIINRLKAEDITIE